MYELQAHQKYSLQDVYKRQVEHAFKVGRYLGWHYGKEHKCKIVLGKDTRRSSYMFEYALVAGLTSSGADAYLLHVTTTPSISYVVRLSLIHIYGK